jgi:hypothetical protein
MGMTGWRLEGGSPQTGAAAVYGVDGGWFMGMTGWRAQGVQAVQPVWRPLMEWMEDSLWG